MINKCLTWKSTTHDRLRPLMLQLLWGMVTCSNVDFVNLIWEEFKYQIESKRISKRPLSFHHVIKLDSTLGNLKFVNKGSKEPIFGMVIPIVMLNDDIKAYDEYSEYLAKSRGVTSVKIRGKGLLTKQGVEIVIERELVLVKETNEPAGDAQVDVQMTEAQPEKPEATLINPVEPEFQSMVDILVTQEKPTEPKPLLVDTTITLIPDTKTISLTQPPQTQTKRRKTKVILKKSNKPDSQVESGELECRVTRLEKKVHAMSSFNLPEAIDNSVKAHLKNVLPKDVPYCGKSKREKLRRACTKNSSTPF
ncbi:hypothetical protein Tco_0092594 [Tanacetum coccineum]